MIKLDKEKVYYLATPYSHKNRKVVEMRYDDQQTLLAYLTNQLELLIIAPIEMCHQLSNNHGLPSGYDYWKRRDRTLIERCDGVIVGLLDGWDKSVGVTDEISYCLSLGKPVYTLNPYTLEIKTYEEAYKI